MVKFRLNGEPVEFTGDEGMPLLWYLREQAGITGTKFGCGVAACGACTVQVDGDAVRSCVLPVGALEGQDVKTIEGLKTSVERTVQTVWQEMDVVQCGYCQSGQIMSATALLTKNPRPSDNEIDAAMQGNLCRCATYKRIKAAIHAAANRLED